MTLLIRLAVILGGLAFVPLPAHVMNRPATVPLSRTDARIAQVATRLAGKYPVEAAAWLGRQKPVSSARLDGDGRTIAVSFRDDGQLTILPPFGKATGPQLPMRHLVALAREHQSTTGTQARAAVLEPFQEELNSAPDAGQAEADILTAAGFKVDVLRNDAVNIAAMETLNQYSVVYMETHSHPGVIATDDTDNTKYAAFFNDGSVKQVTVAGDGGAHLFLAITPQFFLSHLGNFPNSSVLFINGCAVRGDPSFWPDMQQRNVGALIGWDNDVYSTLNPLTGDYVLHELGSGQTVGQSVNSAILAGLGTGVVTNDQGVTTVANLGVSGDGLISLQDALSGAPAPQPTATATPTVMPSPTSIPRDHHFVLHAGTVLHKKRKLELRVQVVDGSSKKPVKGATVAVNERGLGVHTIRRPRSSSKGVIQVTSYVHRSGWLTLAVSKHSYQTKHRKIRVRLKE
ncbi:MAG: hypothetical protein ACRDFS_02905 [Chloroflexota bacterium]